MKTNPSHPSPLILHPLLSHLWLHEPDADTVARAVNELGLPSADPRELASAYTDVFLLNVFPYGSVFTDPDGELNGREAQRVAALYEANGYCPPDLNSVGAPDHLGLWVGFLNRVSSLPATLAGGSEAVSSRGLRRGFAPGRDGVVAGLLEWAPICCLAVERELTAPPFYGALAKVTRTALLSQAAAPNLRAGDSPASIPDADLEGDEISLRDLARFFLTPARCGVFFSRSGLGQIANALGVCLPFGSRFEVAERLFEAAPEGEQIGGLIDALNARVEAWAAEYRAWAETYPAWKPYAEMWLARTAEAQRMLAEMKQTVEAERLNAARH